MFQEQSLDSALLPPLSSPRSRGLAARLSVSLVLLSSLLSSPLLVSPSSASILQRRAASASFLFAANGKSKTEREGGRGRRYHRRRLKVQLPEHLRQRERERGLLSERSFPPHCA